VRETHDAETGSETIENCVNCVECSTEFETEKKSGEPIISCRADIIKVNERGFSRVMFAIS